MNIPYSTHTKPRKWAIYSLVANVCLVVACAATLGRQAVSLPDIAAQTGTEVMKPSQIDPSWIKSGTPKFMVSDSSQFMLATGSISSGHWSCEGPTTFEWSYSHDESIHILEGEAEVEYLGKTLKLKAGDNAFFKVGTKARWTVQKSVRKSFVLHDPGVLAKAYRRIFEK